LAQADCRYRNPGGRGAQADAARTRRFPAEWVEGGEVRGRYSLLGLDPDLVFRAEGSAAEINHSWQLDRTAFAPMDQTRFAALRALVEACRIDVPEGLPKWLACLVGYFGYETIGLVEKLPRAPASALQLPDMLSSCAQRGSGV